MKRTPFVRTATALAICVSLLGGCAIAPPSDVIADQAGQARPSPIVNFHLVDSVASKAMYRGAQPADASQWAFLASIGVKTVLKLNQYAGTQDTAEQERLAAAHNGIRMVSVLMQPEDFPHNLNPFAAPSDAAMQAALAVMEDPGNWPLYVHCSHGRDRTGLLVALYRIRQNNYCKDKAFAEMKSFGHNLLLPGLRRALYRDDLTEHASCIK